MNSKKRIFGRNKGLVFSILLFLAGCAGVATVAYNIDSSNSNKISITQDAIIPVNEKRPDLYVTTEIMNKDDGTQNIWEESDHSWGAVYEFYIHNGTLHEFVNYEVELTVPSGSRIDGTPWNGTFILNDNVIKVLPKHEAYTERIMPKNHVKFGFVFYTPSGITPEYFINENLVYTVTGYYHKDISKSPLFAVFIILCLCGILSIMAFAVTQKAHSNNEKDADERIGHYIQLCANFIDVRDEYTKKHSSHVAEFSRMIARELGMNQQEQRNIYYVGMLHDVGKVMIKPEILRKPGKLDSEEWEEMKKHTTYGSGILQDFNDIPNIRDAVLYHHERFDGKGYMFGLEGENIPLVARIICVADSFDAMATDRAYRPHLSEEVIIDELEKNSGKQFDPRIVKIAIDLIKKGEMKVSD